MDKNSSLRAHVLFMVHASLIEEQLSEEQQRRRCDDIIWHRASLKAAANTTRDDYQSETTAAKLLLMHYSSIIDRCIYDCQSTATQFMYSYDARGYIRPSCGDASKRR